MHVVATAGHVDHGKSTLVRALTGTDPDRHAEEKRRGLTIDLGYAWTTPTDHGHPGDPDDGDHEGVIAFVDVPGHERFITTMLAGLGPAPAVMFVVAADEGWRAQSAEHLAAVDALGLSAGLLVITRSDLADPGPAMAAAQAELASSSLGDVPAVAVSARTGVGLDQLRTALHRLVSTLPAPCPDEPVRLWVDRSFSIRGAGTVVTGTLAAGALELGQELIMNGRSVRVRGLQALGADAGTVQAVSRVAVNLRGVEVDDVGRGDALLTPGRWHVTSVVDVDLGPDGPRDLPEQVQAHVGTAAVSVHVRPLAAGCWRLRLATGLPLRFGDRVVLRDPGRHLVLGGARVVDPDPPDLDRRGSARRRGERLASLRSAAPSELVRAQVEQRGAVRRDDLRRRGFDPDVAETTADIPADDRIEAVGEWLVDPSRWRRDRQRLRELVGDDHRTRPLAGGVSAEVAARTLALPATSMITDLATSAGLVITDGRITDPSVPSGLGAAEAGLAELERALGEQPFVSPEHDQLQAWGLGPAELAAAERVGRILRLAPEVVLAPTGPALAMRELARLEQPFTASDARRALGTTRRVVIPLLEHLHRRGWTTRPDGSHHQVRR